MNIYIENLDKQLTAADLEQIFGAHGSVQSAEVALDGFTDLSREFGYVEMPEEAEARAAIAALDNTELNGRKITVREAPPRMQHKGSYKVGTGPVNQYRFKKNR